ncbi:MAG: hypothetical protein QM741_13415 [Rudaea sp.]|uniref:hypothetical protein n=1 Tax=Rudaea sp. TaxID=2136325 RepID=UPI0039E41A21
MSAVIAPRRGRGLAKESLTIIEAATEILREIQPATVRATCYKLFTQSLIRDMGKGSTDKVSRLLTGAREREVIPWNWIVDETREAERIASWDNPESIIRSAVAQYRKDYWKEQPHRVEVWSEKGTVRGTIAPVLREFGVTFRVMHGYGSATALYGAAQDTVENDKPLTVLYVGDHDPSGLHMSEVDIPERLERYGGEADFRRIALTAQDVAPGTDLPHFDADTKRGDPRYRWFRDRYGSRCWELDALSPVTLRARVENAVVEMLDMGRWNSAVQVEKAERASMNEFFATWKGTISGQASKYSGEGAHDTA